MERMHVLIDNSECVHNVFHLDDLLGILGIQYIGELHFGVLIFLQVIAHYHSHEGEHNVHVEPVAFLDQ